MWTSYKLHPHAFFVYRIPKVKAFSLCASNRAIKFVSVEYSTKVDTFHIYFTVKTLPFRGNRKNDDIIHCDKSLISGNGTR